MKEDQKFRMEVGGAVIRLAAIILIWLAMVMAVLLVKAAMQGAWGGVAQAGITIIVCSGLLRVVHKTMVFVEGNKRWWLP